MESFINSIMINFISHLFLFIINSIKNLTDFPLIFKALFYWLIYIINLILFIILSFWLDFYSFQVVISYGLFTLLLFIGHFIFDEDFLFRFDKSDNLKIFLGLSFVVYLIWFIIIF